MDLLFEANRLAGELAKELRKTLRTEAEEKPTGEKRTIVAYSGNFQPFHAGHYKIYRTLVKKFGRDNVYITTTNQREDVENPMSYEDKKRLATQMFDIEEGKFQEVKNPFVPIELLKKFSPRNTSLVTVISSDDADAIAQSKYFHKYVDGQQLKNYTEAAYYLTVPELTMPIGGQNLTNPQIMQVLGSSKTSAGVKEKMFRSLYGSDNAEMLSLITKRAEPGADVTDGDFDKTYATGQKNASKPRQTKATGQDNETDDDKDKDKTPPMQRMVVNPETGREIKVQSALKYPRWKPVYKKAEKVLKTAGIDRKDRVKEPEVNTRYKKRAQNMKKEDLVAYLGQALSEQLHDVVKSKGATLTVPGLGEVHLKLDGSFPRGLKTESDPTNSTPAPVAIFSGRFQPFHLGHYKVYEDLVNKFGKDNVYIASSNKTDSEKSPFDFNEKKAIITNLFDVDPSHVVQVKSPYQSTEITSQLPPNTPVVWALSSKDAERLNNSKYFHPYTSEQPPEMGYTDGGYVYVAPEFDMNINGHNISGTVIRDVFAKGSPEAKRALFKRLYGKDDPQMFDLISTRIQQGPANPIPEAPKKAVKPTAVDPKASKSSDTIQAHLKDTIKNPETDNDIQVDTALKYDPQHPARKAAEKHLQSVVGEGLLMEGGAFGHMMHPYEDLDLSMGDLRELTSRALGSGLDKDGPVVEKIDGQNIMFTVRDGQVRFARSINQLKNQGEHAMTADELRQKFGGRGSLEHTFGSAGEDLQAAIAKMPPEEVNKIFGNGKKFMNTEIVHPDTENTIPYNKNLLIFHFTVEYDDNGKPVAQYPEDSEAMATALREAQADKQSTFNITGQQFIVLSDAEGEQLESKIKQYNDELDRFEKKHSLTDENTIRDYQKKLWSHRFDMADVELTPEDREILFNRWIDGKKSTRLTALSTPEVRMWAKELESRAKAINTESLYPIQSFVARLGMDSLSRATGLLASQNPKAGEIIKTKLAQALDTIRKSGSPDKIDQIDRFMKLVDDIGLEKALPSEGLVFTYGDKLYKFTGAFAPINRVISTVKYDTQSPEEPAQEPSRMDKLKSRTDPENISTSSEKSIDPTAKVHNPETDNDILVKTALKYDKNHPAHKAAEKLVNKESVEIAREMAALHEYWHGTN